MPTIARKLLLLNLLLCAVNSSAGAGPRPRDDAAGYGNGQADGVSNGVEAGLPCAEDWSAQLLRCPPQVYGSAEEFAPYNTLETSELRRYAPYSGIFSWRSR
ncbi:MAG: hypothetical protein WAK01_18205 [Methylocystis sp.]